MVARYIDTLEAAGLAITVNWTKPLLDNRARGIADVDMSEAERARHAVVDLDGVDRAEFFWLVTPRTGSLGCWVELGHALALGKHIIVSADHGRSIFTQLAHKRFDTHEQALEWLQR